jgi:hypothetical protein
VSEESVQRASLLRSLKTSVSHACRELEMSTVTVWRVLRKRQEMKPYRLGAVSVEPIPDMLIKVWQELDYAWMCAV